MRLAVISDIHGNAVALESVMADMKKQSPDALVCLGDIVMRGPQPKECVDLLRHLDPLAVVRGNYDDLFTRFPVSGWTPQNAKEVMVLRAFEYDCSRLSEEDQHWLGHLPTGEALTLNKVHLELYHAAPESLIHITWPWASVEQLGQLHREARTELVLFGHVHHAFVRQAQGRTVVNCGSVGTPFDGDPRASYAIVDLDEDNSAVQLRRVSYDAELAISIARERLMPDIEAFEYGVRTARYPYSGIPQTK
jgi:putative phosphoesterase